MNNNYVYPAIFHANDDGSYTIAFPDLPGCISEGNSLENALDMAQKVLKQHLDVLYQCKEVIPDPSDYKTIEIEHGELINLIRVELKDERAVKTSRYYHRLRD